MNFETEAREAAVFRIQEILKHPDDLVNKLSLVRKKLSAERALIDAQLRTAVETQLEEIQHGMDVLHFSGQETAQVQNNLSSIDGLWATSKNNISNYARIKKISRTHQNFVATKLLVEQFQKLNAQISRAQRILREDASHAEPTGENLLFVHYQLQMLEAFRDNTMRKSRNSPDEVLITLERYFEKVDELSEAFESLLWMVGRRTLDLVKNGNAGAVVRVVKIIETEEQADEYASVMEAEQAEDDEEHDPIRLVKGYRIKFFDVLREAIGKQVKDLYNEHANDLPKLLQAADLIIDDLILIHDELEPRFPKKYNIFQFFVLEYHRSIYDMVNLIISRPMEAGAILLLLKWVRDYYSSVNGRLGVGEELLEPRLLDDREEELILEYIKLVRQKLSEWLNNLLNTETRDFIERTCAPESDSNGIYLLSGSVIVFQMFNQQVDVVSHSSRGPLIFDVIVECCNAIEEFQKAWSKILEKENSRFFEKDKDIAEGLPEYIVALANDSMRGTEFSEVLTKRIESMVDEPFKTQATLRVKALLDGFMKISRRCYAILIEICIKDVHPATSRFYCPEWYEQNLMQLVVGTFEDYCSDFQEHMQEYLFSKFTTELQDRFIIVYIESMKNKGSKLKMPGCVDRMKADLELIIEFFSRFRTAKRVKAAFEVKEKIINFIESNPRMIFLDFYSLWKAYQDLPLTFVEDLLNKRDDLDRSQVKEIMEQCKERVMEERERSNGKEITPSVFSKAVFK
ncbi:SNARE-binding exocyst subunit S6 [Phlyctochytrium planicorne]|nr:SNARE-binding exocyst subunit S6 [Phlyctochytrium planicorne]